MAEARSDAGGTGVPDLVAGPSCRMKYERHYYMFDLYSYISSAAGGVYSMNDIVTAISTVGFPIVCTIMLMYLLMKENENHKDEMNALKDTIANNTIVLTELKQLLNDMLHDRGVNNEIRD